MAYSSITKPSDYFNTITYSGNGSTQSITGVNFQPDWVWIKARSGGTQSNNLYDSVRGATKYLRSDSTIAEGTQSNGLTSFDSDGFSMGNDNGNNGSGYTYVSWNWLASNTTASNTDGSITSTVSANTTAGFSIVSYTGTGSASTIGHGLGAVPKMIITKQRSATQTWYIYNINMGNNKVIEFNTNASYSDNTWNSTTATSSVFTVGNNNVNGSGITFIAYCFAEKKGYSKFGSYTGNGNADGTFVYTGFKPAWIMIKRTDSSGDWIVHDIKRPGYNGLTYALNPNLSSAEATSDDRADFLSNCFKLRTTGTYWNASGGTYIYMAFAENPFVGNDSGTGIPATAR